MKADRLKTLARRLGFVPPYPRWLIVVAGAQDRARSRTAIYRLNRAAHALHASPELQAALETVERLGNTAAVTRFLAEHSETKLTEEEAAAKREEATRAAVARRAEHARKKLAEHEAALAREERLVAKWRKKVAYYEGRGR